MSYNDRIPRWRQDCKDCLHLASNSTVFHQPISINRLSSPTTKHPTLTRTFESTCKTLSRRRQSSYKLSLRSKNRQYCKKSSAKHHFHANWTRSSLFFARCYAFVPIIHETKFRLTDNNVHVKLAMFALASRQDTAFAHVSDTLYGLAKQTTTSTLLSPNMDTLIAMIMLAIYEIGQPSAALNASTTLGSALALVSAFQLVHLDDKQSPSSCQWLSKPKNWIVEEGRRRVVLMVLSLSRWVSTITGREFGLPTRTAVKLSLPVSNAVWVAVVSPVCGSLVCESRLPNFRLTGTHTPCNPADNGTGSLQYSRTFCSICSGPRLLPSGQLAQAVPRCMRFRGI